MQLTY